MRLLIRQGEGPLEASRRLAEEHAEFRAKITRMWQDIDSSELVNTPSRATAAGDSRKLRGIPAIARGVSGAVPGTQPEAAATRSVR